MPSLPELLDRGASFLEQGGPALWGILLLSFIMWYLILKHYWFLRFAAPLQLQRLRVRWAPRREQHSPLARRQREALLAEAKQMAHQPLGLIESLSQALPLLGLLGTVSGMIQSFDVITVFGNGNARGLAGGISQALLTTMAGLVTALSGLYFNNDLKQRAQRLLEEAATTLNEAQ